MDNESTVITAIDIARDGRMAFRIERGLTVEVVYVEVELAADLADQIRYVIAKSKDATRTVDRIDAALAKNTA